MPEAGAVEGCARDANMLVECRRCEWIALVLQMLKIAADVVFSGSLFC